MVTLVMGKEEQIKYWIETSDEDWKNERSLLKDKRNLAALFFAHLTLEKILKAHWTKCNDTVPPKIHDLIYLHDQTDLELEAADLEILSQANNWKIEGRYPDFKKEPE